VVAAVEKFRSSEIKLAYGTDASREAKVSRCLWPITDHFCIWLRTTGWKFKDEHTFAIRRGSVELSWVLSHKSERTMSQEYLPVVPLPSLSCKVTGNDSTEHAYISHENIKNIRKVCIRNPNFEG